MGDPAPGQHSGGAADSAPLWRRLGWMAAIWAASVLALGAVAGVIRLWLKG